ncbi:MAG: hypothetical protein WGN25_18940 [Candidatus Electrothrix sp. GW3-4]|uniref:hypothetical protein n=1 Tax=Candidatus Electrothrix sp. GW3-4 TaxID=3126740 RepID=UPI0030D314D5
MNTRDLTGDEQSLLEELPKPPVESVNKSTNIWIIEWLPTDEQHTGQLLHEWMQERRSRWSKYSECKSSTEVLASIKDATDLAERTGMIPVLHIEAHGNKDGLGGPNGKGGEELLSWERLTDPLQRLNFATNCNLVVVIAACIGFAGIKALTRSPIAPAVALVGPDAEISPGDLLSGTKEFYRRWMDNEPRLSEITDSASRESGGVYFDWEPYILLAYQSLAEHLIISLRKDQQDMQKDRLRARMSKETNLSEVEIESRLAQYSPAIKGDQFQQIWDQMFLIDI